MDVPQMETIATGLQARGYRTTVEYPGFLLVSMPLGSLNIGTANGEWGGDVTDSEGRYLEPFEMEALPLSADAPSVLAAILDAITAKGAR